MATFSKKSLKLLETCHPDIQKVMHEAIKHTDFSVLYGTRTASEQFELYKVGRKFISGKWVIAGKTVTNLDGNIKKSNHNYSPSKAIDIAPYPIDWSDIQRFKDLAVVIKQACKTVGIELQWGGDWKSFIDYPHWEVKEHT
jgi:peptidoglycan L-alanyl-D-glutamate endopeptidase CwlK